MFLLIYDSTTGPSFQPSYSLLESCRIVRSLDRIIVQCAYHDDSTATGFQVIAQLSNSSEVPRLYANKTTDRQTPASVVVEENGLYQVTIFAIRGERGIVDEYMNLLMVEDALITTTTVDKNTGGMSCYSFVHWNLCTAICPL